MPPLSKRHEKSSEAYRPSDRYASLLFKEAGTFHAGPASMRIKKIPDKPKSPADRSWFGFVWFFPYCFTKEKPRQLPLNGEKHP